ncbi:MAG TPA: type II secretion system protein [Chthoniobacteraceae bacterium]|nr:type II secretion system protein [Chthoniobacteraceae bacterium]
MNDRRAFTLLELLLGVAVIGILALLVMSYAQGFRDKANAAQCISNLRAISSGLFAYAAEHNGSVMPKVPKGLSLWPPAIDTYIGGLGTGLGYDKVTSPVWACPENRDQVRLFKTKGYAGAVNTGYPINSHLRRESADGSEIYGIPMSAILHPARKVYLIESCQIATGKFGPKTAMLYTPYDYYAWMKQVHPPGNNVLFCDGHIEPVKPEHDLCSKSEAVARRWWLPAAE